MEQKFVHLHVHTEYSLLDGAIRCPQLVSKTKEYGMPAVAMTDHGVMYGAVEFYEECKKQDVKPIMGCEIYVSPEGISEKNKKNNHLLVLAQNNKGYQNLVKLVSIANTEGFYYKPRVDHHLLAQYSEGLIISSACLAGEIPQFLIEGREEEALKRAMLYRDIFGKENFYLELMYNQVPEQAKVNRALVEMAKKHDFPLIATNDAHYLNQNDHSWHELLLCVGTNSIITDPNRMSFGSNDFYLRSPQEMWGFFGNELPQALTNTLEIAERCDVNMELSSGSYLLPKVDIPEGHTIETYFAQVAKEGLNWRMSEDVPEEYTQRLEYELGVINQMGFPGYFLIISDVIVYCKNNNIPIGPGRGSAAGSLVAWAMRITELDPIRYGLIFERFLNPERISMPDIDTDVSDKGREELLKYIVDKYGIDNVSQIITFGRMKSKQAIKDVGRAMGMPYSDVDKIAKLVPFGVKSIGDAIEISPDLKEIKKNDVQVANLLDSASNMEGLARHCSQHAAGVVITPVPLTDVIPIRKIGDNQVVTQFSMEPIEHLGLVKMDFLGLQTLSIIEGCLENIAANGKAVPDINNIPFDDSEVFKLLQKADTLGIFQLESTGMRRLIKRMKPDKFDDLVAILALYRPGPLDSGMVDVYVECKHGRKKPDYMHPSLEPVLKDTYGVILYQEQVMQCASVLAGYSLGGADLLRRAMGKKKIEVMAKERAKFVEGAVKNNVTQEKAEHIFDMIETFAGYGFNKSHSAAYAVISYQTAYLKTYYPVEFLASYLSSKIGAKKEIIAGYIKDIKTTGMKILPPDINQSRSDFTAAGEVIRFGLSAVARVGASAVESIIKARQQEGKFTGLWDFVSKVDLHHVNKSVTENLIKAGAFDNLHPNRCELLESLPSMIDYAMRQKEDDNQFSLFEELEEEHTPQLVQMEDFSTQERLDMEKESIGMYITGHPLDSCRDRTKAYVNATIGDLPYWKSEKIQPSILGLLVSWKEKYTKKGDAMGVLVFDDGDSEIEVVCFPKPREGKPWLELKHTLSLGKPYLVRGKLDDRGDMTLIANQVAPIDEKGFEAQSFLQIEIPAEALRSRPIIDLSRLLKGYRGNSLALLKVTDEIEEYSFLLPGFRISPTKELSRELKKLYEDWDIQVSRC